MTTPHASKDGNVSHLDTVPKVPLKARNVEPWHGPREKELSGSRGTGSTVFWNICCSTLSSLNHKMLTISRYY